MPGVNPSVLLPTYSPLILNTSYGSVELKAAGIEVTELGMYINVTKTSSLKYRSSGAVDVRNCLFPGLSPKVNKIFALRAIYAPGLI